MAHANRLDHECLLLPRRWPNLHIDVAMARIRLSENLAYPVQQVSLAANKIVESGVQVAEAVVMRRNYQHIVLSVLTPSQVNY
jgi:hypothetical protein